MFQSDQQRPQQAFRPQQTSNLGGYYEGNPMQNNYGQDENRRGNWNNIQPQYQGSVPDDYSYNQQQRYDDRQEDGRSRNYNNENQLYDNGSQSQNEYKQQDDSRLNNYQQQQLNRPPTQQQTTNYERNDSSGYQQSQRPTQLQSNYQTQQQNQQPPVISHAAHSGGAVFGVVVKQPSPMSGWPPNFPSSNAGFNEETIQSFQGQRYNNDDSRYQQQQTQPLPPENRNNFQNERSNFSNQNYQQQDNTREPIQQSYNNQMYDNDTDNRDRNWQQQQFSDDNRAPLSKPDNRFIAKNVNQDRQVGQQQQPPIRDNFYKHRTSDYDANVNVPPLKSPTSYRQNDPRGQQNMNRNNFPMNADNQPQYNNQSYNNEYENERSRYNDNQPPQDSYYNSQRNDDFDRRQPPNQNINYTPEREPQNVSQRLQQNQNYPNNQTGRIVSPARTREPQQNYPDRQFDQIVSPSQQQRPLPGQSHPPDNQPQRGRNILPDRPRGPQQTQNFPVDISGRRISPTRPQQNQNFSRDRPIVRNVSPNNRPQQSYPPDRQYNENYSPSRQPQQNFNRPQQPQQGTVETKSQNMQAVKNMFERKSSHAPPLFPKTNVRPVPPRPNIPKPQMQQRPQSAYYNRQQPPYPDDRNQQNNSFDNLPLPPPPEDMLNNAYVDSNQYDDRQGNQPQSSYNYKQNQDQGYDNRSSQTNSQDRNFSSAPKQYSQQPPPIQKQTTSPNNRYDSQQQNYNDQFRYQQQQQPNIPAPPPDARNNQQSYSAPINVPQNSRDGFYNQNQSRNELPFEQYRDNRLQEQQPQSPVRHGNIPSSKSWSQPFNNRGSRTSFTEDQRQYDRGTRGSTGTYDIQQNIIEQNSLSPRTSYSKPPQKQTYSKSMNNLDQVQVQDTPHIEIESYEESTFENGTTFSTSPNLKPVVVAVTFNDGLPNKPIAPKVHSGNVYRIQPAEITRQPPQQKPQPRVSFPEPPTQPYIPPEAQNQFVNDNSSELSNYVPSVVARSYDAFSQEQAPNQQPAQARPQQHTTQPTQQSLQQQNDNRKAYSQIQYTVQGTRREGIPTPPRTDRPPQQRRNQYQENAPKPVLTKQSSDEGKKRRQPVSYATDQNWRVISPTNSDLTATSQQQQQVQQPQVVQVQAPYSIEDDDDDSSEGIDVDAPTPPPKAIQKQPQFFRDSSGKSKTPIYQQSRPQQITNETPKGYHHPTNQVTSVKPPISHGHPHIKKPQRNGPLSPTFHGIPQKETVSEEDSGIFDDKNGSTLSNVSSRDKVRLGKSGAMGRRKPPTRLPSSQNITEDVEDESDFQIEVTNSDLKHKPQKIEVHREQSMKEIRKKQALRKALLEQEQQRKAKEQMDESVQTEFPNNVAELSPKPSADSSANKTSSKFIFKVPDKSIPTKDVKDIPIAAYEDPKDIKKQPKYDDLLGKFKNARDSALKSAHIKQAGALKAVTGAVRMSKKHEPEPKKKLIPRPEKNAHVLQRAQDQYKHDVKHRDEVEPPRERERRPSPEKSRPRDYREDDRRRPEERRREELERERRIKEREPDYPKRREERGRDERDRPRDVHRRPDDRDRRDYHDRRDAKQPERGRNDNFRRSDDMRRSPQKYREQERERREPSRGRRIDYDDDIRRDPRYDPTRSPHKGDYNPRDREPDWVQQFRRNRGPESQGSDSSRVSKRAWVNDPRRRQNRELDMDEFEREPPRRQVMPTKLMAKKPPPQHKRPPDDWMKNLKQKNKTAERHRYRRY